MGRFLESLEERTVSSCILERNLSWRGLVEVSLGQDDKLFELDAKRKFVARLASAILMRLAKRDCYSRLLVNRSRTTCAAKGGYRGDAIG